MDYFSQGNRRRGSSSVTQDRLNAPPPPGSRPNVRAAASRESLRPPSSIRLRRLASGNVSTQSSRPQSQASNDNAVAVDSEDTAVTGRRRSSSAPQQRPWGNTNPEAYLTRQATQQGQQHMAPITEGQATAGTPFYEAQETPRPLTPSINVQTPAGTPAEERFAKGAPAMDEAGNAARHARGLRRFRSATHSQAGVHPRHRTGHDEYSSDVVDLLDLVGKSLMVLA
jgi:hypothetical protein